MTSNAVAMQIIPRLRIDEVDYDHYYHELINAALAHGLGGAAWASAQPGVHVARAAKMMVSSATEFGHLCPVSMAYAVIPTLRSSPQLAATYEPLLRVADYDPGLRPPATKRALIAGRSMTEKQGGSDVRANKTSATPQADGTYRMIGHKWFTSAPMSNFFLTLAQAPGGLSCFLLPRVLDDAEATESSDDDTNRLPRGPPPLSITPRSRRCPARPGPVVVRW